MGELTLAGDEDDDRDPQDPAARLAELERKVLEHEAKLLEQEHRPYRILYNFLVERRTWPKGDPRRRAAWAAAIGRFLTPTPGKVIIAGGGLLTLLGVLLALHANVLLARQNRMIAVQTALGESARRSSLVFELSAILDQIDREVRETEAERAAEIEKGNIISGEIAYFGKPSLVALSDLTHGRIVALSRSLRPYQYLETNLEQESAATMSWLSRVKEVAGRLVGIVDIGDGFDLVRLTDLRSPERAQLLISLVASNVDVAAILVSGSFDYADLRAADLSGSSLKGGSLEGADLRDAKLVEVDLSESNLGRADLTRADLTSANLERANLSRAIMREVNLNDAAMARSILIGADLKNAMLDRTQLAEASLIQSDLSGADLNGANLSGTDVLDAKMTGANVANCDLRGVRNLTQAQIDSACTTETSIFPEGILRPINTPEACSKGRNRYIYFATTPPPVIPPR